MATMNEAQKAGMLQKQIDDWPKHLAGAKEGNPYATLCTHCFGRHRPPNDEICPHEAPDDSGTTS